MRRFLTITLLLSTFCYADVMTDPWPKKVRDFPQGNETLVLLGFKITCRNSPDQTGSGTGGHMEDITIQKVKSGAKLALTTQCWGSVAILESHRGWPQLEIWGRAGGGNWSRSLFRFTGHEYECVRIDDFNANGANAKDKSNTASAPNGEDAGGYYVGSRIPDSAK